MRRTVTASLAAVVRSESEIVLAIAAAANTDPTEETLEITVDGEPLDPALVELVAMPVGGRQHLLTAVPPGRLQVEYRAIVTSGGEAAEITTEESLRYRRPSRYVDIDRLEAVAAAMVPTEASDAEVVQELTRWVSDNTAYIVGVSRVTDGASETYLARAGVCRDFAHLLTALLRARGIPARVVAVYAPGLFPMDFHAVVECWVEGAWRLVDATHLAPRTAMVRICTGLDAADTAFFTVHRGRVDFDTLTVTAVAEGDLPSDNPGELFTLA